MKNIFTLLFAVYGVSAWATCSSPISRTNNSPNTVLTSTKYNLDLNTVYTKVNNLAGDCITDATITNTKIVDGTIARTKLATGYKDVTVLAKTSSYTVLSTDEFITADATAGAITLTLPTAVGIGGRQVHFKKLDGSANLVTLDGNGAETIDGATTLDLSGQNDSVKLISNGSNWITTGRSAPRSEIYLYQGNGHGSVSTKIRRFSVNSVTGTAAVYADSATAGMSITIVEAGLYSITYYDGANSAGQFAGVSKNSAQLTTNYESITAANRLGGFMAIGTSTDAGGGTSFVTYLVAGDVLRAHTSGNFNSANGYSSYFRITKVSN